MIHPRILFTFGTLYEPSVISALLGYEPQSFLATVRDYAVFRGTKDDLSEEIKNDISQKRDLAKFVFLFAKKVDHSMNSKITGKAYQINAKDELIIDWWERYPKWYRKEDVEIYDNRGEIFQAVIYAVDRKGELLTDYSRNPYDLTSLIENAKQIRNRVKSEFTGI